MRAANAWLAVVLILGCTLEAGATPSADGLGEPIDLSGFSTQAPAPIVPVAWEETEEEERRFYLSGIIGASFATLQSGGTNTGGDFPNTGAASSDLLTAGAAAGFARSLDDGQIRFEVEGRGRDLLTGQTNSFPPTGLEYDVRAADGWSVLANLWRDWDLTDNLGWYAGGGIGGGGYRLFVTDGVVQGYNQTGAFAWQVGAGLTCQLFSRTALDLGYRFFDIANSRTSLNFLNGGAAGAFDSSFYASELLLSVRVYEPFRRW